MSSFKMAVGYVPFPEEVDELQSAFAAVVNTEVPKYDLLRLGGPNDVVQFILDSLTWQNVLEGLAATLGASFGIPFLKKFGEKLGEHAADEVWKNKANYYEAIKKGAAAPFLRFIDAIKNLRSKGRIVVIAVELPYSARHVGIVITSDDPAEVAFQIANLIRCSEDIRFVIQNTVQLMLAGKFVGGSRTENPDTSIRVEILDDGTVRIGSLAFDRGFKDLPIDPPKD